MNILIVDDNKENLFILTTIINKNFKVNVHLASSYDQALEVLNSNDISCILLDIMMPEKSGIDLLKFLKSQKKYFDLPIIMVTALEDNTYKFRAFEEGASDYITKPFNPKELVLRLKNVMQIISMKNELKKYNTYLNDLVNIKIKEVIETRNVSIYALAKLAESRDAGTGKHINRMMNYCKYLAKKLQASQKYGEIDKEFIENIYNSSILHDIGKVGIPDSILLKPGRLTSDELEIIKTHTLIGGKTLEEAEEKLHSSNYLKMGKEIAYYHHERWDGKGYPYGLSEYKIPLAARIVAIADVFDALLSQRVYKPALPPDEAVKIMINEEKGHFEPYLFSIFLDNIKEIKTVIVEANLIDDSENEPVYLHYLKNIIKH